MPTPAKKDPPSGIFSVLARQDIEKAQAQAAAAAELMKGTANNLNNKKAAQARGAVPTPPTKDAGSKTGGVYDRSRLVRADAPKGAGDPRITQAARAQMNKANAPKGKKPY